MELTEYIENNLVHSIHTSERRSFRACRRRWDWAYRELYFPRVTPPALEFGIAFHTAMEHFYNPVTWSHDPAVKQGLALVAFRRSCENQLDAYKKLNGLPSTEVSNEYKERLLLGLNMIRHYTSTVSPIYDQQFEPVDVELAFEVPVLSPENEPVWCKCNRCWAKWKHSSAGTKHHDGWQDSLDPTDPEDVLLKAPSDQYYRDEVWQGLPVTYGGRLDMLAKDKHGRYWIFDWKTTKAIMDEDAQAAFLALDDQISSYVWALRRFYSMNVAGFVYVEIKKAFPTTPEPLKRKYKGRSYSTSRDLMTNVDIYEPFVKEHDPQGWAEGAYDEYLEHLRSSEGPKFHQRHQIHKNDDELDAIGHHIYLEALDMVGDPRVYPMPGRFSCTTCVYRQPCLGANMGEDYRYTLDTMFEKKTKLYYEEKEPSTD